MMADCVAKLFAALRESNNQIRLSDILNQWYALAFISESILLILIVKIVLQHNRGNNGQRVAQGLNRYAVIDPSRRFATPRSGSGPVLQFVTVVANTAARHRVDAHASIEPGLKRRIGRQPSGGRRQLQPVRPP